MPGQLLKGDGPAVELFGQLLAAREGAVGYQNFIYTGLQQVGGRQFGHFARAHQQGLVGMHIPEDSFSQLHCRVADGYGAGGHGSFRAHPFGYGKCLVQQAVENHARGMAVHSLAVGVLQLTQDLGFAQDHGIQAGGHGKQMAHGFQVLMNVDVRPEFVGFRAARPGPAFQHLAGHVARARGQQFHAITGGKNHGLAHRPGTGQGPMLLVTVVYQGEALAHIHARRAVIETHKKDIAVHSNARLASDEGVMRIHEGVHHND